MNDLWKTFGYFTWKYSDDFICLCGQKYIWIYMVKTSLMKEIELTKLHAYGNNYNPGGFNILEIYGPCGPIVIK